MATNNYVAALLLQAAIEKMVGAKLSELTREFAELTKDMDPADKKVAGEMILEMVDSACGLFTTKMRARLAKKSD